MDRIQIIGHTRQGEWKVFRSQILTRLRRRALSAGNWEPHIGVNTHSDPWIKPNGAFFADKEPNGITVLF
jgi:hypothetical protein